ncbi:MAG: SAM-dependent methyltransferase [Ruminococcus sp.]|nr:SAM-dependent methyltransferase [Ruminococcus sp.]
MLPNRLRLIASMVKHGSVVADIGTDHAYLPVYLVKENICPRALACDIRPLPLEKGRQNISLNHLEDKIETRLSDGLNAISKGEADTFTIAGMGADVLIHILSSCDYIKSDRYTLIIQPMSRYYELITWLYQNGFVIENQKCTHEGNRRYTVIKARYTGQKNDFSEADTYIGAMDLEDSECREFLQGEIKKAERRAIGNPELKPTIEELKENLK